MDDLSIYGLRLGTRRDFMEFVSLAAILMLDFGGEFTSDPDYFFISVLKFFDGKSGLTQLGFELN
jgi:hypothetical protein